MKIKDYNEHIKNTLIERGHDVEDDLSGAQAFEECLTWQGIIGYGDMIASIYRHTIGQEQSSEPTFEPPLSREQQLKHFTDDELLVELQNRKRLMRCKAEEIIAPEHWEFYKNDDNFKKKYDTFGVSSNR